MAAEALSVLITRPAPDAEATAAALTARGFAPVVAPLFTLVLHEVSMPAADRLQALLFTSANGVRAYAAREPARDLPAYCVGDATAAAAEAAGFRSLRSAKGDAAALATLVRQELKGTAGALLHPTGRDRADDLPRLLEPFGFRIETVTLYSAEPVAALPQAAAEALKGQTLAAVLLYSPRAAQTFRVLTDQPDLSDACRKVTAVCISAKAAEALAGFSLKRVLTAAAPNEPAMLAALETLREAKPEPRPAPEALSAPAPRRSGRMAASVLALGGIAALVASGAWVWSEHAALARRVAALEAAPRETLRTPDFDSAAFERRLAAVEGRNTVQLPPPSAAPAGLSADDIAPLRTAIDQLAARLTALETAAMEAEAVPPAAATAPAPDPAIPALQTDLAAARQAVDGLAARVTALEGRAAAAGPAPVAAGPAATDVDAIRRLEDEIAALRTRIEALPAPDRLAALEAQGAAAITRSDLDAALQALGTRIAALEGDAGDDRLRRAAAVLAAADLVRASQGSAPFPGTLDAVRGLMPETDLTALQAPAAQGVPEARVIAARLPDMAREALAAERRAAAGNDALGQIAAGLEGIVTVRRTGDVSGDDTEARLARAELAAQAGDLAAALREMEPIGGAAGERLDPWRREAASRLVLDAAASAVLQAALARLDEARPAP